MTTKDLGLIHRFEPGVQEGATERAPLLLLHGTGGDEADLLPLGRMVAPGAALLSPRGAVLENGMPRFFRRLAEGVFDEADLRRRAHDLADFVAAARAAYGIGAPVALGFSNGANIAAATMLLHPETFAGAVLLRPMLPFAGSEARAEADADLAGRPVLMLSGALDPIVPEASAAALADRLARAGAALEHRRLPAGHGLSQADVALAQDWLAKAPVPAAA